MMDFYEKIYGYEDNIRIQDDDMSILESGMYLQKMTPKENFNKRFYRLDLNNNQLVASTKEFRKKEKLYPLISLNEVKIGCSSDNLKSYKLKKIGEKKKDETDLENLAFCITYDNHRKTIDLIAPNAVEQLRWTRVLSYFISLTKKRKGIPSEADNIYRNYFELADTSNNQTVSEHEFDQFLHNHINIKVKSEKVKDWIKKADMNNDGKLTEDEFIIMIKELFNREDIFEIFNKFHDADTEYMPLQQFMSFVNTIQMEGLSEDECIKLINKYEDNAEYKQNHQLSKYGFVDYLINEKQFIERHQNEVYQNMDYPIFCYFVNSSHNTYLSGDQITSKSSADCYRIAIMNGARLVEMDVHDGPDDQPIIYHQKTLTSKILFEEAISTCKEYAFKLTEYPLIITIELHCSPHQQKVMADIIKRHIFDYLYTSDYNHEETYPTMNDLKNKIIVRCKNPNESSMKEGVKEASFNLITQIPTPDNLLPENLIQNIDEDSGTDEDENENNNREHVALELVKRFHNKMDINYENEADGIYENDDFEQIQELSHILNVMQNVSFKGVDYNFEHYKQNQTCSLSESGAMKLIESESPENVFRLTQNYLMKIYPAFFRQNSSNLNAIDYWIYGFQIVALNFQTNDISMNLNNALFNDNGNCGYVLKPNILLDNSLMFDPNDLNTMKNKKELEITIISGHQFKMSHDFIKDISDPYVVVSTYGVKADCASQKTLTIKDNGFNPKWNAKFIFQINCPELAFLKMSVKDDDIGKDHIIGEYTLRFQNIRQGYRHLYLKNKSFKGMLFVRIKISQFNPYSKLKKPVI